jgi:hypothetical protein
MDRTIGRWHIGRLSQAHREARLVAIRAITDVEDEAPSVTPRRAVTAMSRVVAGSVRSATSPALRGRVAGA